jgi:MoaA/NifB/PqqE/SkfB family radical SAM enzyme
MLNFLRSTRTLLQGRIPGQLVLQLTDRCNAFCPQCGMRVTEPYKRSRLSNDDVRKIIDAAAQRGVRAISFTGGEPLLLLDDLIELIHYAHGAGLDYIRTGTNGFVFRHAERADFRDRIHRLAERLARTPLRNFWISIDSAIPSVHEAMRGFAGVLAGVEKAVPIFHEHGIFPSANLGINRNIDGVNTAACHIPETAGAEASALFYDRYKAGFRKFYRLVINQGFSIVNTCYPMSIDGCDGSAGLKAVYGATSKENLVNFSRTEKSQLFKALLDTIPEFRSKIRIFSPTCSLYSLCRQYAVGSRFEPNRCYGGIDFFFIDAKDGRAYPCGFRGAEDFGRYWEMNVRRRDLKSAPACNRCDWECFRDPSEMFGPLLTTVSSPWSMIPKLIREPAFFRHWYSDLNYYRACGYFNGREAPDYDRIKRRHEMEKNKTVMYQRPIYNHTDRPSSAARWGR